MRQVFCLIKLLWERRLYGNKLWASRIADNPVTLGARFTFLMVGLIVLTGIVLVGGFLRVERKFLVEEGRKAHQTDTQHLAHLCAESMVTNDELGLVNFLKELRRAKDLKEAYCVDTKGKFLAHSTLSLMGTTNKAMAYPWNPLREKEAVTGTWTYSQTATRAGRPIALACSTYASSGVEQAVQDRLTHMLHRSLSLAGGVLCLALFLSWGTARALTRPIRKLAQGVRRVGGGDWSVRVPENGPGELSGLAKEFNLMSHKLGDLDRLKDEFVNNVSHDLRNPLSAIATSAKMLRTETLPATSYPLLRVIESAAVRLRTMVNNILDTAKMRDGRLVYEKTVFHPQKLCEELIALFDPMAKKSGKTLVLNLAKDLPSLYADEEKVLRIFLNLLSNAFKFTKEGDTVTLAGKAMNGWAEFRVSDTGWGIAPDRLASIFKPFHSTSEGPNAPPKQGTGLGLSIVKALVEGHGGRVEVHSVLGKGTTFILTLPPAKEVP